MFIRRLGQNNICPSGYYCAQILEMEGGDFAGVGEDIRAEAIRNLPAGPGVGPNETVVKIPRKVMLAAVADLLVSLR